jgi:cell division protein FtsB
LLGMLGSAHDGEALSAARKAVALIKKAGMTWPEVLTTQPLKPVLTDREIELIAQVAAQKAVSDHLRNDVAELKHDNAKLMAENLRLRVENRCLTDAALPPSRAQLKNHLRDLERSGTRRGGNPPLFPDARRTGIAAMTTTEELKAVLDIEAERNSYLQLSVYDLGFSTRVENGLKNWNIETVQDLVRHSASELLRTPHFGRKSLNEINSWLANRGLSLGFSDWDVRRATERLPALEESIERQTARLRRLTQERDMLREALEVADATTGVERGS